MVDIIIFSSVNMSIAYAMMAWMLLILLLASVIFISFSFLLGLLYPQEEYVVELESVQTTNREIILESEDDSYQNRVQKTRRMIGIFALVAIVVIMIITGVNALTNTGTQ